MDEDNEAALDLQSALFKHCHSVSLIFSEQQINSEFASTVKESLHLTMQSLPMEHSAMYLTLFTQQHT